MKARPVGVEISYADRQTDGHEEVAFGKYFLMCLKKGKSHKCMNQTSSQKRG